MTVFRQRIPLVILAALACVLCVARHASAQAGVRVFVPNSRAGTVTEYASDGIGWLSRLSTIPIDGWPEAVAVRADQRFAYISVNSPSNSEGEVYVIDALTYRAVQIVTTGVGWTRGIAIRPDGRRLYAANDVAHSVAVFDVDATTGLLSFANRIVIPIPGVPGDLAVAPDGTRLYVIDEELNRISVIDTSSDALLKTIPLGSYTASPGRIAINPAGTKAYVTARHWALPVGYSPSVEVIDIASGTVIKTVLAGFTAPEGLAVSPDGGSYYVADNRVKLVKTFSAATDTLIGAVESGPINIAGYPWGIVVAPAGRAVYVTNNGGFDYVAQYTVNPETGSLTGSSWIGTGDGPAYLGICRTSTGTFAASATFTATATSVPCISPDSVFTGGTLMGSRGDSPWIGVPVG